MATSALEQWTDRIEKVVASDDDILQRVIVLRETESTQDAARRFGPRAGDVVVAWRQTAGRGRLGRTWADTREDGVALSIVIPAGPPQRLALALAIAVADAAQQLLQRPVGIKWPNDIVVDRRKLAGILVEQSGPLAVAGIGMNVAQKTWPQELADRAVSLAQLGRTVDRLDVIVTVLESLCRALGQPDDVLVEALLEIFPERLSALLLPIQWVSHQISVGLHFEPVVRFEQLDKADQRKRMLQRLRGVFSVSRVVQLLAIEEAT